MTIGWEVGSHSKKKMFSFIFKLRNGYIYKIMYFAFSGWLAGMRRRKSMKTNVNLKKKRKRKIIELINNKFAKYYKHL